MTKLVLVKIKDVKNRERFSFYKDGNGNYSQKLELVDDKNFIIYTSGDGKIVDTYGNPDKFVYVNRKVINLEKFRYIFAQDENGEINTEVMQHTDITVIKSSTNEKYVLVGHLSTFAVPCLIAEYWAEEIRKALNS